MFLFESTVMDGAPVFSLVRESMPAAQILGFEGILNSCTNLIIGLMEEGYTFDEAVEYAQSIGITETDPSGDIDGWDAAIKVALLATVLMGEPIKPQQVAREGIRDLSATEAQQALRDGGRWKLVCRAEAGGRDIYRPRRTRDRAAQFAALQRQRHQLHRDLPHRCAARTGHP